MEVAEGDNFEAHSGGMRVSTPSGGISRLFDAPILENRGRFGVRETGEEAMLLPSDNCLEEKKMVFSFAPIGIALKIFAEA